MSDQPWLTSKRLWCPKLSDFSSSRRKQNVWRRQKSHFKGKNTNNLRARQLTVSLSAKDKVPRVNSYVQLALAPGRFNVSPEEDRICYASYETYFHFMFFSFLYTMTSGMHFSVKCPDHEKLELCFKNVADLICRGWERRASCKLTFTCDETTVCMNRNQDLYY